MSFLREPNAEPIPGYRLIEPLGSGGFGEVWKCEAPGGLFKAIKFVYGNLNSVDDDCARAEQEQKALERIKEVRHPFICSLEVIKVVDGELVIVMELAERTLHDLFVECQAAGLIGIPRADLLRYMGDAAEALDHMNEKHNLQHLDVKPRNLFLNSGHVKVADFGLVKQLERTTSSGLLGGVTPLYAAPETFNGKMAQQTDQYSLAVVYQELLTGHRPFAGKNARQLAQQHMQEEPDTRALPEAERPIVARALAKDPSRRWPNCFAFVSALYKARSPLRVRKAVPEAALVGAGVGGDGRAGSLREISLEESGGLVDLEDLEASPPPGEDANPDVGLTIPAPSTGALRPTLIIGIGAFGRKAILELRCRFLDRFGDLSRVPVVRFLCADTDPEAIRSASRGAPDVALSRNEFFHLPLQPVVNYRRRSLEHLSEWLPREKIYAMPRSLQTQGSRALGRLAFADNQQRLMARLKRELQEVTDPDTIYQAVTQTGLALRDNTPRIYVIAAAGGGGSGLLPDLGYAIRRLLAQLRHPDSPVHVFLQCGAPQDPASPKQELANVYATLTELNHFSDPTVRFVAQYSADGQRIVDEQAPYSSMYLLPLAHRGQDSLDETVAHLGNYLFHELTTPLGLRLDHYRRQDCHSESATPSGQLAAQMRSFGTYAVWFPRGLLMRLAGRHACQRLIRGWLVTAKDEIDIKTQGHIRGFLEKSLGHANLQPEALARRIEESTSTGTLSANGQTQGEILAGILAKLEEQVPQPVAQEDPGNWAKQAMARVRDWVGSGDGEQDMHEWRKTRLARALSTAAQQVAEAWDAQLSKGLFAIMDFSGARVAAAESALEEMLTFFRKAADAQNENIARHATQTVQAWRQLEQAMQEVSAPVGFRLFGGRSRARQLRTFMDCLAQFARQRLAEEILGAVRHAYAVLSGKLTERGRDLVFVRQRLRHLQDNLEHGSADPDEELVMTRPGADFTPSRTPLPSAESFLESICQSATARVVLPNGEEDLERAAVRFLHSLTEEQWLVLDKEVHERVFVQRGGLHGACVTAGDIVRQLAAPLLDEIGNLLSQHLPIMDVAQILGQEACVPASGVGPATTQGNSIGQVQEYLERAKPLVPGKLERKHYTCLLAPGSTAGKALAEATHAAFPEIKLVPVAGQTDLMVCREQGCLTAADLQKLFHLCRSAYEAACPQPASSPHGRFDVLDWTPLDP